MPKRLTDAARELRGRSTDAEMRLWHHLRAHRLGGLKFKRQQPLGPYIVDFMCFELCLIVEADGAHHLGSDADRDEYDLGEPLSLAEEIADIDASLDLVAIAVAP